MCLMCKTTSMKKIFFKFLFLAILIGFKIGLSSSSVCPNCNGNSCFFLLTLTDDSGLGILPLAGGGYVDFSQAQTSAGWSYSFHVESTHYCGSYTVDQSTNSQVLQTNIVELLMPESGPFKITVDIKGPCGNPDVGQRYEFTMDPINSDALPCFGGSFGGTPVRGSIINGVPNINANNGC